MPTNLLRLFALIMLAACPILPGVAQAAWPHDPNGNVPLCNAIRLQSLPAITSDGAGGAIVAWQDQRNETNSYDLFAQRVDANGVPRWTTDGVPVAVATNGQLVVWLSRPPPTVRAGPFSPGRTPAAAAPPSTPSA